MGKVAIAVVALWLLAVAPAFATHPVPRLLIDVFLNGQSVVGIDGVLGVGDPDGSARVNLDDNAGHILNVMIAYEHIGGETISGMHIHGPCATGTTNGPLFIDIPLPSSAPLPSGVLLGRMTTADDPDLFLKTRQVFFNPSEFYVDLHTNGMGGFPAGAVRAQLPEPAALALAGVTAMGLLRRGKRHP